MFLFYFISTGIPFKTEITTCWKREGLWGRGLSWDWRAYCWKSGGGSVNCEAKGRVEAGLVRNLHFTMLQLTRERVSRKIFQIYDFLQLYFLSDAVRPSWTFSCTVDYGKRLMLNKNCWLYYLFAINLTSFNLFKLDFRMCELLEVTPYTLPVPTPPLLGLRPHPTLPLDTIAHLLPQTWQRPSPPPTSWLHLKHFNGNG